MSVDVSTPAGVLRFCAIRRAEMARAFERQGRFEVQGFSFSAWLFATHEVRMPRAGLPDAASTGAKLDHVTAVAVPPPSFLAAFGPGRAKEVYSKAVRGYARHARAVGTVFMGEIWQVEMEAPEGAADLGAEASKQRRALPSSLENVPGRQEALVLWLEHAALGNIQWSARISRDPTRLAPWQETERKGMEGRFVNLTSFRS